jgi:mRNA-degrading endonuclease RelE of RelBE toxin-antitoxin system
VGSLRIIFQVDEDTHEVKVGDIVPRGQVYRRL